MRPSANAGAFSVTYPCFMAFSPTQKRDLRLLTLLRGIALMGDGSAVVAIFLRLSNSGHPWNIALLAVVTALPTILLSPVAGFVLDNYSAKKLLSGLSVFEGLTCIAIGYFHQVPLTLALMFVLNIGIAFSLPGYSAYLPTLAGEENITRANGILQTTQGIAQVFGPALGGVLVGSTGGSWPLYIDAIALGISAVGVFFLKVDRRPDEDHVAAKKGERDLGSGFRLLFQDRLLFWWCISTTAFIVMLGMIFIADVFFITKTLHASALQYGLTNTFFGLGTIVGSVAGGKLKQDVRTLVRWGEFSITGIGVTFGAIGLVESIYDMYPLLLLGGVFVGLVNVCYNSMFMIRSTEEFRGRIASAASAIFTSGNLAATALGGIFLVWLAPRTIFQAAGVASVMTVMLFGPLCFRQLRNDSGALAVEAPVASHE